MYDKYKKLQDALKKLLIRSKEDPVTFEITGEQKIKDVKINSEELERVRWADNVRNLEKAIKTAIDKWQAKAQELAMEKTKEILWFDPNDLAGMMWGMWGRWGWWFPGLW